MSTVSVSVFVSDPPDVTSSSYPAAPAVAAHCSVIVVFVLLVFVTAGVPGVPVVNVPLAVVVFPLFAVHSYEYVVHPTSPDSVTLAVPFAANGDPETTALALSAAFVQYWNDTAVLAPFGTTAAVSVAPPGPAVPPVTPLSVSPGAGAVAT
jgi:hypothetical protein